MSLLQVVGGQWAIDPLKLVEISSIYSAHLRGTKPDIAAIEARLGKSLNNEPARYAVRGGVAILPLEGVIAKKMNMLMQVSGGTSSQLFAQAIQTALSDPTVHSIVLDIDSPGGTVDGTQALADIVFGARSSGKNIVALGSGAICSAAYWIASAAQHVYVADSTTAVGSIGVVTSHTDISGAEAAQGIKTTELSAGKYKRITSQYSPLTSDGRKSIQESLDYTYSLFVDAVAKNRNVTAAVVLSSMADGRVFIGKQAVQAGLVDGIMSMDQLVHKLTIDRKGGGPGITNAAPKPISRDELHNSAVEYVKAHPGTDYVSAVQRFEHLQYSGGTDNPSISTAGAKPLTRDELHNTAVEYVKAHPGVDYLSAVKLHEHLQ